MSELIDQLRKRAEEIGSDWSDHSMLLTVISVIERQQAEIDRLKEAVSIALNCGAALGWHSEPYKFGCTNISNRDAILCLVQGKCGQCSDGVTCKRGTKP